MGKTQNNQRIGGKSGTDSNQKSRHTGQKRKTASYNKIANGSKPHQMTTDATSGETTFDFEDYDDQEITTRQKIGIKKKNEKNSSENRK